jgi:hypothetical protein
MAGATSSGQRSRGRARHSQAQHLVGPALRQPGDEVGAGRRDQHRVGRAAEVDVRHGVGFRASHWLSTTGRPDSACSVTGVMNCVAASVITTCTWRRP